MIVFLLILIIVVLLGGGAAIGGYIGFGIALTAVVGIAAWLGIDWDTLFWIFMGFLGLLLLFSIFSPEKK